MAWAEKLPSGRYRGVYRDRRGRRRSLDRTFTQQAEAKREAAKAEDRTRRPGVRDEDGLTTYDEWAAEWWPTRRVEPSTAANDRYRHDTYILSYWRDEPIGEITREAVQKWVRWVETRPKTRSTRKSTEKASERGGGQFRADTGDMLSPTTVLKIYRLFSSAMRAAVAADRIHATPCIDIETGKAAQPDEYFMTRAEFARLRKNAPDALARVVLDLGVGTGMRWGEMVGLHRSRIDLDQRRIIVQEVREFGTGEIKPYPKGRARRGVPITDELAESLGEWMRTHPAVPCRTPHRGGKRCSGSLLLTSGDGTALNYSNFRRDRWDGARDAAGLDGATPHDMRHTYASWLVQDGVTIEALSELLGHASISTTQRYAHLADTQWSKVRDVLGGTSRGTVEQGGGKSAPHLPHGGGSSDDGKIVPIDFRRRSRGA